MNASSSAGDPGESGPATSCDQFGEGTQETEGRVEIERLIWHDLEEGFEEFRFV